MALSFRPDDRPTFGPVRTRYHSVMRRYPYVHVDVFTRTRFGGNQLAVFTEEAA